VSGSEVGQDSLARSVSDFSSFFVGNGGGDPDGGVVFLVKVGEGATREGDQFPVALEAISDLREVTHVLRSVHVVWASCRDELARGSRQWNSCGIGHSGCARRCEGRINLAVRICEMASSSGAWLDMVTVSRRLRRLYYSIKSRTLSPK
jgi:hypothetical protein